MIYRQNPRLAAIYIVSSGFMFAIMGACIKLVSEDVSTEFIVFFRNLFGFMVLLPFLVKNGLSTLATQLPWWHLGRSLAGLAAMYCFFYSIAYIPLSESVLLSYTTPLFAPFMAYFLLKEKFSSRLLLAIVVGFIGVTFLLNPEFNQFSWVSLVALSAGMFAAMAMTAIRRMSKTEPASRILFYYGFICTSVSALPLLALDSFPDARALMILVAVGAFATLGQFFLTRGYSTATAAQVGPFTYSTVLFATILGIVFWQEIPSMNTAIGIILVVIAGSFALRKA